MTMKFIERMSETTTRKVMDRDTAEHFSEWLERSVAENEQHGVEQAIHELLRDDPDLIETHSWPEMRSLTEGGLR